MSATARLSSTIPYTPLTTTAWIPRVQAEGAKDDDWNLYSPIRFQLLAATQTAGAAPPDRPPPA